MPFSHSIELREGKNMKIWMLLAGAILGPAAALAADQEKPVERAGLYTKLIDCRSIADPGQRLACYDAQVATLEAAVAKSEVVVVDKVQIKKARRSLFGLTLPNLSIFGNDDNDGDEDGKSRLETKIGSAAQRDDGKWLIILEDGAKWLQTDSLRVRTPKPGQPVKIRKAAMGSYLANINGQIAIRVTRVN